MSTDNQKKRKLEEDDEATDSSPPAKKQKLNDGEIATTKPSASASSSSSTSSSSSSSKKPENKNDDDLKLPESPLNIIFLTGNKGKLEEVQNYVGDEIKKYIINHKIELEEIQGNEKEILTQKLLSARKAILKKLDTA